MYLFVVIQRLTSIYNYMLIMIYVVSNTLYVCNNLCCNFVNLASYQVYAVHLELFMENTKNLRQIQNLILAYKR